jgi:hypothetical protein
MNDIAALRNSICRGTRPSGPRYVRDSSAIRPAGSSRTCATRAAAQSTAVTSLVMRDTDIRLRSFIEDSDRRSRPRKARGSRMGRSTVAAVDPTPVRIAEPRE